MSTFGGGRCFPWHDHAQALESEPHVVRQCAAYFQLGSLRGVLHKRPATIPQLAAGLHRSSDSGPGLAREIAKIATEAKCFRPMGTPYFVICLPAAWACTTDSDLQGVIEELHVQYASDHSTEPLAVSSKHTRMKKCALDSGLVLTNDSEYFV